MQCSSLVSVARHQRHAMVTLQDHSLSLDMTAPRDKQVPGIREDLSLFNHDEHSLYDSALRQDASGIVHVCHGAQ